MEIVLYELDIPSVKSTILFKELNDKYIIDGYDRGKTVKEAFGGYGYEYSMSFKKLELNKLKDAKESRLDDDSFIENWIKQFINDPNCFSKIKAQFDKFGIDYTYLSWRDAY